MIVIMVKMLGICPICKKFQLQGLGDNHYKCEKCGVIVRAKITWKVVRQ